MSDILNGLLEGMHEDQAYRFLRDRILNEVEYIFQVPTLLIQIIGDVTAAGILYGIIEAPYTDNTGWFDYDIVDAINNTYKIDRSVIKERIQDLHDSGLIDYKYDKNNAIIAYRANVANLYKLIFSGESMSRKKTLKNKLENEKYNKHIKDLGAKVRKDIKNTRNNISKREWTDPDVIVAECIKLEEKWKSLAEGTIEEQSIYKLIIEYVKSEKAWYHVAKRIYELDNK